MESLSQHQEGTVSGGKATAEEFFHLPIDTVFELHKYAVFS